MKINIIMNQQDIISQMIRLSIDQNANSGIQTTSVSQLNQAGTSPIQSTTQPSQPLGPRGERALIWQGLLEWDEKPKNPTDQKITKCVLCQVSANSKDGEPELKADGWPFKLTMQLMPKQIYGNIGGAYLKNSKSLLFHPQLCEELESLTKLMNSGFAGCIHYTDTTTPTACHIKVIILFYAAEKGAYLGLIPNDQGAFVGRLREVIQQQKSILMHQGGTPSQMGATAASAKDDETCDGSW